MNLRQDFINKNLSDVFFFIKHTCGARAAKPYSEAPASSSSRNGEPEERFIRISSRTQDRDLIFYTSIKPLSPAFSKQDLTDGSTLVPPKADISPRTLGTWIQSPSNRPSFLWFDLLDWSAINRNMSEYEIFFRKQYLKGKSIHLYFSSKAPLHMIVIATLKDRTRICPDRWLKCIEIGIYIAMNIKYGWCIGTEYNYQS